MFNLKECEFSSVKDFFSKYNLVSLGMSLKMCLLNKNVVEKDFSLVNEEDADFTFIFSSPEKTDELCAPLETNGIYSCRNEEDIIINYFRWENGAVDFGSDMKTYRLYLINHENNRSSRSVDDL